MNSPSSILDPGWPAARGRRRPLHWPTRSWGRSGPRRGRSCARSCAAVGWKGESFGRALSASEADRRRITNIEVPFLPFLPVSFISFLPRRTSAKLPCGSVTTRHEAKKQRSCTACRRPPYPSAGISSTRRFSESSPPSRNERRCGRTRAQGRAMAGARTLSFAQGDLPRECITR
jgi:hypothetical protein